MISIPLKHNPKHNCFDDVIAAIAQNEYKDYQFMFSNAWTFSFKENGATIGECIQYSPASNIFLLEKCHGIEMTHSDELSIKTLNQKHKYAGAYIDTFKCPWDKGYMKYHNYSHTIIINKIDIENEIIHIADPFYGRYEEFKFKDFAEAYCGAYYITVNNDFKEIDDISLLKQIVKLLEKTLKDVEQINVLKERIAYINVDMELSRVCNIWHSAVVTNLNKVSLDRLRYSAMLCHLSQKKNIPLVMYINELEQVSSLWTVIRNLVVKFFMSKDYKSLDNVKILLEKIINIERSICFNIIHIISQHICKIENSL